MNTNNEIYKYEPSCIICKWKTHVFQWHKHHFPSDNGKIFNIGKYKNKGKKYIEILLNDRDYCRWIYKNVNSNNITPLSEFRMYIEKYKILFETMNTTDKMLDEFNAPIALSRYYV